MAHNEPEKVGHNLSVIQRENYYLVKTMGFIKLNGFGYYVNITAVELLVIIIWYTYILLAYIYWNGSNYSWLIG